MLQANEQDQLLVTRMRFEHQMALRLAGGTAEMLFGEKAGFGTGCVRGLEQLVVVEGEVRRTDAGATNLGFAVAGGEGL